jgi:hypothetical protein
MRRIDPWRIAEQFISVFLALLVWSLMFLARIAG